MTVGDRWMLENRRELSRKALLELVDRLEADLDLAQADLDRIRRRLKRTQSSLSDSRRRTDVWRLRCRLLGAKTGKASRRAPGANRALVATTKGA